MAVKVLRWGFCSAGYCAHEFASAMDLAVKEGNVKVTVAARDVDRAEQFAKSHGFQRWSESYEELAQDNEVDIVYIASLNISHFQHCKLFLSAGKHVVCEKPLTMTLEETEELLKLAEKKNLFFMEAVWSRFFPVYQEVLKQVKSGELEERKTDCLGEIKQVFAHFHVCWNGERVTNAALGGSALLDIGLYIINFADFIFDEEPTEVKAVGTCFPGTSVDHDVSISLKYPAGQLASLTCSLSGLRPCEATVCGTRGYITIKEPFHAPTQFVKQVDKKPIETVDIPLPEDKCSTHGRVRKPGFVYQIRHVKECIDNGLTQSPIVSHAVTRRLANITKKTFQQI